MCNLGNAHKMMPSISAFLQSHKYINISAVDNIIILSDEYTVLVMFSPQSGLKVYLKKFRNKMKENIQQKTLLWQSVTCSSKLPWGPAGTLHPVSGRNREAGCGEADERFKVSRTFLRMG